MNPKIQLISSIRKGMKKNKIKSVMMTTLMMERDSLISKEKMEKIGKDLGPDDSVNDDLESFIEGIQQGQALYYWYHHATSDQKPPGTIDGLVTTYFLPKLTQEELKLVDKSNSEYYLENFVSFQTKEDEAELKLSESKSRYAQCPCIRFTIILENKPKNRNPKISEPRNFIKLSTWSEHKDLVSLFLNM